MQALLDLFTGFIAMIAATALAQFGVILDLPRSPEREVHRVADCHPTPTGDATAPQLSRPC